MKVNIEIDSYTPMKNSLDFSCLLDAPAGKHGFVKIKDGHFYFDNGNRIRFFGVNFAGGGMMPDHESAEKYAERLASMGCNLVRLHAGDINLGWPSILDYNKGSSTELDMVCLDRLDYFVKQLKDRGIYLQVDLHCYRVFKDGDGLDYPDAPPRALKSVTMYNKRLIELQKEFATKYLTHFNPYTGVAFIDDPAVMCIQITNENGLLFYWFEDKLVSEQRKPYEDELKSMFNAWLVCQYRDRDGLVKAWTRNDECTLNENEDPQKGTVEGMTHGSVFAASTDHRAYWAGQNSPARYADYMRFADSVTKDFYEEMVKHLHSLKVKVPINGSNLLRGIADIFAASEVDLCENNAYYNHPRGRIIPEESPTGVGALYLMKEDVLSDPRTTTDTRHMSDCNMVMQLAGAAISGKPFAVSEWNEYGAIPFHSTSFLMQAAYACLQDWDGLMIWAYTLSDNCRSSASDTIHNIFECYNDPSLICQFGLVSSIFLKGLVKPAHNLLEVCFSYEDLWTLPPNYLLPYAYIPFVSKVRTVFLDQKDPVYRGDADIAISSGFTSSGDYRQARHAFVYARSPYADALQHKLIGNAFLDMHRASDARYFLGLATLDSKSVVINDADAIEQDADFTGFSRILDGAMKYWGLLENNRGLTDNSTFVSDTGEISFSFNSGQFVILAENLAVFSGYPHNQPVKMGERFIAKIENEKMSISLLPLDGKSLTETSRLLVLGIGETGNDGNKWINDVLLELGGKIFIDRLEGSLYISNAKTVRGWSLDTYGKRLGKLRVIAEKVGVTVVFEGKEAAPAFEIEIDN